MYCQYNDSVSEKGLAKVVGKVALATALTASLFCAQESKAQSAKIGFFLTDTNNVPITNTNRLYINTPFKVDVVFSSTDITNAINGVQWSILLKDQNSQSNSVPTLTKFDSSNLPSTSTDYFANQDMDPSFDKLGTNISIVLSGTYGIGGNVRKILDQNTGVTNYVGILGQYTLEGLLTNKLLRMTLGGSPLQATDNANNPYTIGNTKLTLVSPGTIFPGFESFGGASPSLGITFIPEPSTYALMGTGLGLMAGARYLGRRRRKNYTNISDKLDFDKKGKFEGMRRDE